jgi:multidrug efflux pump
MSLSSTSIQRPVLTVVLSVTVLLMGYLGFRLLGVREYPSIDPPVINVSASYVGANADVIENQITEPLEQSINGIAGVKSISSTSREGGANITVEFELGVDLEAAANDVRDRVSRSLRQLPPDMDPPSVSKADANASPIIYMNVASENRDPLELSRLANDVFKERLQTIPGVAECAVWGEKKTSMRIWLDPARLAAHELTPLDVQQAINRENIELPGGRIEGSSVELSVRTLGLLSTENDFNRLVVAERGGRTVRIEDVGYAHLEPENQRNQLKRDGVPTVIVILVPQPGANNIAIADEFYKRLEDIKRDLPADIKVPVAFDGTVFIRHAIDEVVETLAIAFVLVLGIIFLFLRDWRSTLIPVLAIPISLVGAFFFMWLLGFSINVLTLLALVLSIGLVVDDAIVVLENIYTKIEAGIDPVEAGNKGSAEIYFAVIATTVVLVAVFLPVIFLQGLVGQLFREFGLVVAAAVAISAFVALTLTPMLSTKLLRHRARPPWFYRVTEPFFVGMERGYRSSLNSMVNGVWVPRSWIRPWLTVIPWICFLFGALAYVIPIRPVRALNNGVKGLFKEVIRRRSFAIVGVVLCSYGIYFSYTHLKSELAPLEDRSNLRMVATAAEGTSYPYMVSFMDGLEKLVIDSVPESRAIINVTAPGRATGGRPNTGFINLFLKEPTERGRSQQQIADALTRQLPNFSSARVIITQNPTISTGGFGGGLPVQYVLQAPNFQKLREYLPKFVDKAREDKTFQVVDVNLKFNKPELRLEIDRNKARSLGVSTFDIARTLQLSLSESRYGFFIQDGKQYQILGGLIKANRDEPLDLRSIYVRSGRGELIQLDNLVKLSEQATPPELFRYNRYVAATVSASLATGKTLGDGIAAMDALKAELNDPAISSDLAGQSRDYAESSSSLLFAFVLALIMIYLVLAAQFESVRDPLVILLTVPLALLGALGSLYLFNQTLNIFSQIGIIMLIGLVTKNGILIVEFANQRREHGLSKPEAVIDAATGRLRPILMTSLATALGFLPIALALGAGSESRVSMGITVVGGVLFSTLLTLYMIPALYTYIARRHQQSVHPEDAAAPTPEPLSRELVS